MSALAGTDLRSFEVFVAHARRHRASLADWMREQGLFTSVLFFSPQPENELYSRRETDRLAERGLLSRHPHFPADGVVDISQVPRFPDFRPSVATLLGGAGPDLGGAAGRQRSRLRSSACAGSSGARSADRPCSAYSCGRSSSST